jgi:hypothetical protein
VLSCFQNFSLPPPKTLTISPRKYLVCLPIHSRALTSLPLFISLCILLPTSLISLCSAYSLQWSFVFHFSYLSPLTENGHSFFVPIALLTSPTLTYIHSTF